MWIDNFDERQKKEIEFAKLYADRFSHGTDGHNAKLIVAKMAKMLDNIEAAMTPVPDSSPHFVQGGVRYDVPNIMGFPWSKDDQERD